MGAIWVWRLEASLLMIRAYGLRSAAVEPAVSWMTRFGSLTHFLHDFSASCILQVGSLLIQG
jgi:hypothetical protein